MSYIVVTVIAYIFQVEFLALHSFESYVTSIGGDGTTLVTELNQFKV